MSDRIWFALRRAPNTVVPRPEQTRRAASTGPERRQRYSTYPATSLFSRATSVRPVNSKRTLPSPENHKSSSASRSKVPAVSVEKATTLEKVGT